eukprot:12356725-Karenia_brevis.AAC.1
MVLRHRHGHHRRHSCLLPDHQKVQLRPLPKIQCVLMGMYHPWMLVHLIVLVVIVSAIRCGWKSNGQQDV